MKDVKNTNIDLQINKIIEEWTKACAKIDALVHRKRERKNATAECNRTLERYVERSYKFKTYRKEFRKKTAVWFQRHNWCSNYLNPIIPFENQLFFSFQVDVRTSAKRMSRCRLAAIRTSEQGRKWMSK